jgi:hypothetical protein
VAALDDLEQYLGAADVLYAYEPVVTGGGGHQNKFAVVFDGGVAGFCKPASGIADGGRAAKNEVAAWTLSRILDWSDLIAATVFRTIMSPKSGQSEEMAIQVFWPGNDFTPPLGTFTEDEIWRAAIFDQIILHTDRQSNNWLGVPPAQLPFPGPVPVQQQQLKLIDHGYAFGHQAAAACNSSFSQSMAGRSIPEVYLESLRKVADGDTTLLCSLIGDEECAALVDRVYDLVNGGKL